MTGPIQFVEHANGTCSDCGNAIDGPALVSAVTRFAFCMSCATGIAAVVKRRRGPVALIRDLFQRLN